MDRSIYLRTAALASAVLLCGGMGSAQMRNTSSPTPPGQNTGADPSMDPRMNGAQAGPASTDRVFVKNALQGGLAEVQLGQLTLQKSSNDQVKQFAQRMIDDHTKLNEEMKPVAQQVGVDVPTEVSKKDRKLMEKMQALSGPAYDQAYIKDMVKDHKNDLSEFQAEASSGHDQTVKDAASQGSKVIAQHLQMAQQLAKDQNLAAAGQ
jgi:putative membrane protein